MQLLLVQLLCPRILEICVLAALRQEDAYGYKLVQDISACVAISESTLYPILKRLEGAKCLTVYAVEHNGRLRKYYRITEAGRARIREFLAEWQDVMRIYRFIEGGNLDDEG